MHTQAESRLINSGEFSTYLGDTYAVCVVTEGECPLKCEMKEIALKKGDSFLIGADSGKLQFNGNSDIIFCIA